MSLLKKWDPFQEFINRFFEEDFFPVPSFFSKPFLATDVYEKNGNVVVEMEVPGFTKDDIEINFFENYLKIEGKIQKEKEEKERNYWRKERKASSFVRVIPLPVEVDVDKAEAFLEKGILRIVLPKVSEDKTPGKKIEIR